MDGIIVYGSEVAEVLFGVPGRDHPSRSHVLDARVGVVENDMARGGVSEAGHD